MIKVCIVLAFDVYSFNIPNPIEEIDKKCSGKGKQTTFFISENFFLKSKK